MRDRRRPLTVYQAAADMGNRCFQVTRRFATQMTLWAMIMMLVVLLCGLTVATSIPVPAETLRVAATKPSAADERALEEIQRNQSASDAHDAEQDARQKRIEEKLDAILPVIVEVQMYQTMQTRVVTFGGSVLGAVLIAVLTLLVQRFLKIKPEAP